MRTDSQRVQRAGAGLERARRGRGDCGAIMAEAALITPFFIMMIFGILEFGGLFRDYLTLANGASSATREAAIAGNANNADGLILEQLAKATTAMPNKEIETIVVWHATGPNDSVPSACAAGTATDGGGAGGGWAGACNVYTSTGANPWWTYTSTTLTNCTGSSPQQYWCPTARKTAVKATNGKGPPDYLGVYIKMRHPWITGLFGSSVVVTTSSVTKLETTALV